MRSHDQKSEPDKTLGGADALKPFFTGVFPGSTGAFPGYTRAFPGSTRAFPGYTRAAPDSRGAAVGKSGKVGYFQDRSGLAI